LGSAGVAWLYGRVILNEVYERRKFTGDRQREVGPVGGEAALWPD
jgi:hypothetical protein